MILRMQEIWRNVRLTRRELFLGLAAGGVGLVLGRASEGLGNRETTDVSAVYNALNLEIDRCVKEALNQVKKPYPPPQNEVPFDLLNDILRFFSWASDEDWEKLRKLLLKWQTWNQKLSPKFGETTYKVPRVQRRLNDVSLSQDINLEARTKGWPAQGRYLATFQLPYRFAQSQVDEMRVSFSTLVDIQPQGKISQNYSLKLAYLASFQQPSLNWIPDQLDDLWFLDQ